MILKLLLVHLAMHLLFPGFWWIFNPFWVRIIIPHFSQRKYVRSASWKFPVFDGNVRTFNKGRSFGVPVFAENKSFYQNIFICSLPEVRLSKEFGQNDSFHWSDGTYRPKHCPNKMRIFRLNVNLYCHLLVATNILLIDLVVTIFQFFFIS